MFSGIDYSRILPAMPRTIELNYTGTTYVGVGEFTSFDLSCDPVTTPGDPNGALITQYYRISMRWESLQTASAEISALSDAGQLNAAVGLKISYPWGTFTIGRTTFEFRVATGYSGSEDEGAQVLRWSADLIVTPAQLAAMIAYT